jgi:hypothetical protein
LLTPYDLRITNHRKGVTMLLQAFYSRAELAAELKKSERTLYRWERLRYGPPVTKIGNAPHYHKASVEQWLQDQQERPHGKRKAA